MTDDTGSRPKKPLVMPKSTDPCPCGSGAAFSTCCQDHLPGFHSGAALKEAFRRRDLAAAMIAARADIAQYVIWHRTNTEPLLRMGHPVGTQMLEIDIDALADAVDSVVHVHWISRATAALMAVLERLRSAIQSPRWNRKMTFFQVKTEREPSA